MPAGTVFGETTNGRVCPHVICGPEFVGASPNLDYVVLQSAHGAPYALTEGAPPGGLYEWSGGRLSFIGTGYLAGTGIGSETINVEHASYGASRAVSDDDGRVVFNGSSEGLSGLLLRDPVLGETVQIGGAGAAFVGASSDASRVFYLEGGDLYEYDLDAPVGGRVSDLTVDGNPGESAGVKLVLGSSDDGPYVYFAAKGVLAQGAHTEPKCETQPQGAASTCNLYVRHDGVTRLVTGGWRPDVGEVRVSPSGQWLAFMSNKDLAGYDTIDAVSGQPDEEVYLYHAETSGRGCWKRGGWCALRVTRLAPVPSEWKLTPRCSSRAATPRSGRPRVSPPVRSLRAK